MKLKLLTIKKKSIFATLLCVLCIGVFCATYFPIKASTTPKVVHTIVIDAGHGGIDGGAEGGTTGITESELNLQFSLQLKNLCEEYGFNVVLTRKDMNGLYSAFASNKKRSEMEKRRQIIESSNPDLVVSIHMNSFKSQSARGAQVFYALGSEPGEALAQSVQDSLASQIEYSKKLAKVGDYYIVNCTDIPSILVECGFLSNPEEENLLISEDYQLKFCNALLFGILSYFSMMGNG